jgi:superfamily II RNA helicase
MPDLTTAVPAFAPFVAGLPFRLSAYQQAALEALSRPGVSVVVVAPTGSGKSVVADAAVWQALESGPGAAYTRPP